MGDIGVCSPGSPADRPLHTIPCPLPPRVLRSDHSSPKKETDRHVFFCPYTCSPRPHHLPLAQYCLHYIQPCWSHWACDQSSSLLSSPSLHLLAHRAMILGLGLLLGYLSSMPQSSPQWYDEFISCLEGSQVGARTQETFGN